MDIVVLFGFIVAPILSALASRSFYRWSRSRNRKKTSPTSLLIGNVLVLAFLLSFLCLVGELYFRFFYDTTDSFGLTKVTGRWFERHFQGNVGGFRDSVDYETGIPAGQRRVTFLGDSFTVAHGVNDVENRFANLIRKSNPSWNIHVLATCGWDTNAELHFLEKVLESSYELDTVVLVYCLNDVADIVPEWAQILDRISNQEKPNILVQHSYLFNTLHYRLRASREPAVADYFGFVRQGYEPPLWEIQRKRMRFLRDLVVGNGGQLVVVTFPFIHALGSDYKWADVHVQINEMWNDLRVPHLDLLPVFREKQPHEVVVNAFDAHPNEFAHLLAASAIDEFLHIQLSDSVLVEQTDNTR